MLDYRIIKKDKGWSIQRPDKSLVDGYVWPSKADAEKRLDIILAYLKAWSDK